MNRNFMLLTVLLVIVFVLSCGGASEQSPTESEIEGTVQIALEQTIESLASPTPEPSPTPAPVATTVPTTLPEATAVPTATPIPPAVQISNIQCFTNKSLYFTLSGEIEVIGTTSYNELSIVASWFGSDGGVITSATQKSVIDEATFVFDVNASERHGVRLSGCSLNILDEEQQVVGMLADNDLISIPAIEPTSMPRAVQEPVPTSSSGTSGSFFRPPPVNAWRTNTATNPLYGSKTFTASLDSTEGRQPDGDPVLLVLRCEAGRTEIYIVWDVYLGLTSTSVTHRVGSTPAATLDWGLDTSKDSTFFPSVNDFGSQVMAQQIGASSSFSARTAPYLETPITATWDLTGSDSVVQRLRETCRW